MLSKLDGTDKTIEVGECQSPLGLTYHVSLPPIAYYPRVSRFARFQFFPAPRHST